MPSRASRRPRAGLVAMLAALWCCALAMAQAHAQDVGEAPTDEDVAAAIELLKADPNLSQERKTRALRWELEDREKPQRPTGFARWLLDFFVWLGQLSRALVWVVGGLLALGLAWFVFRTFRQIGPARANPEATVPTHVRDLDIRPESLPDDIGAAALALWRDGGHRTALALLYRGLLSRLAHVHQVPIRDSSTEGDCLALARRHLSPERHAYVAQLIGVWQRAIYGGRDPASDEVEALCAGFDAALAAAPSTGDRTR